MTISLWLDSVHNKTEEEVDVVVVGAGIGGAAAAYWLSKRQGLKVAIVEALRQSMGASGRNGGFILRGICAYYNQAVKLYGRETAAWIFRFNEETQAHLLEFVKETGNSFQLENSGSYLLACSLEELQDLEESATLMHEDNFAVEYLRQDPIDRGYYGALYNPADCGVQPALLVKALLEASGAQLHQGEPVHRIDTANGINYVRTPERTIKASKVLLATNAYLPLLMPRFAKHIKAVRGQVMVTKPVKERLIDKLCYANYGYEYFRQLADGRFLLGGSREAFRDQEVGYEDTITSDVQNSLNGYLKDRFPEIAGRSVDYRWSGIMAFTEDGLPLVGKVADQPEVYFAVGCNSHGMGYSLALGKLFVDYALDNKSPGVFDVNRNLADSNATVEAGP
ncbi:MAG: FAD-binding oxidoreductase [Candidatus Obscuribacterales bacterium]|nr:FAD-binding oxidoreductase [Candidatus Obscuribacterales bacterium]